jgi:hypothetical protein
LRVFALLSVVSGLGCSNLLGIEDPRSDFGGDGGPRSLVSISIAPNPISIPLGASLQLTALGQFDDGSEDDVTPQTQFSADGSGAIEVTPTGLATALAQGSSTVTAMHGRIVQSAAADVGPAAPDRVIFNLADFRMSQRQSVRLHAIVVLTDGTMQDATPNATYSSDMPAVATVTQPGRVDAGAAAGEATISATIGGARAGTVKATVGTKTGHPVINEFQTGGAASPADEWVEVMNPCTMAVDVTGWTLVYRGANTDGALDTSGMIPLSGSLAPGEIRIYAGEDYPGDSAGTWTGATGLMGQNNGAVGLRAGPKDTGPLVDAAAYGTVSPVHPFIEGTPVPAMINDRSAQRLPFDGRDGDDGASDFMLLTATTPNAPNAP